MTYLGGLPLTVDDLFAVDGSLNSYACGTRFYRQLDRYCGICDTACSSDLASHETALANWGAPEILADRPQVCPAIPDPANDQLFKEVICNFTSHEIAYWDMSSLASELPSLFRRKLTLSDVSAAC